MTWRPNLWAPTKGKALTHWLPDDEFEAARVKHKIPQGKDGFAVWGRWWAGDEIYLRASHLNLFPHEARHIEQGHFHD